MDPKDLDDPGDRRPAVPPEQKRANVKRQVPAHGLSDGGGDEPYRVDPQEEAPNAPDLDRTGPVADRAREAPALWDRQRQDEDETGREGSPEGEVDDAALGPDDVEIRRGGARSQP